MTDVDKAEEMARDVEQFYRGEKPPLPTGVRTANVTDQQGPVDDDATEYRVIFRGSSREYQLHIPSEKLTVSGRGQAPALHAREYIGRKTGRPTRKVRVALEHDLIPGQEF